MEHPETCSTFSLGPSLLSRMTTLNDSAIFQPFTHLWNVPVVPSKDSVDVHFSQSEILKAMQYLGGGAGVKLQAQPHIQTKLFVGE